MRTVTFIGLLMIAFAIRISVEIDEIKGFIVIVLLCSIFMDVVEFLNKLFKK